MSTQKGFRITQGKGFQITFPNGYTVSVQFGTGNYCDNKRYSCDADLEPVRSGKFYAFAADVQAGLAGSDDAETAVMGPDGKFVPYNRDGPIDPEMYYDVQDHMTVMDVLKLLVLVSEFPKALPASTAEEVEGEVV